MEADESHNSLSDAGRSRYRPAVGGWEKTFGCQKCCALLDSSSLLCFIAQPFIAENNCEQSSSLLYYLAIGKTKMCLSKLRRPNITAVVRHSFIKS